MFWENFVLLCNKRLKSPNKVCADLGYSSATATKWKNGSVPRDTTLKSIADYFGITVEELIRDPNEQPSGTVPDPAPSSPLSAEFYDLVDQLTLKELREIQSIMEEKIKNRK